MASSSYCGRTDVEIEHGATNVSAWADLDGDQDATKIAARIESAIEDACEEVENRLRGGVHEVPLPFSSREITNIAAVLAGCALYAKRGAEDTEDGKDRLQVKRERAYARLASIRTGDIVLDNPAAAVGVPAAVRDHHHHHHHAHSGWSDVT